MGRKLLAVVPAGPADTAQLERFHANATDAPLLTVVAWSARANQKTSRRQLAVAGGGQVLLELQRVQPPEGERSWFVANDVQQDGGLVVFSQVDPLFVLLSCAWDQRARFMSVEDLAALQHNAWLLGVRALTPARVELVCDIQSTGGDDESLASLYVKASEPKILKWLRFKVERVALTLATQEEEARRKSMAENTAFDQHFLVPEIPASTPATAEKDEIRVTAGHRRDAIDTIGDYLPGEWIQLLYTSFDIKKENAAAKTPTKAATAGGSINDIKRFDRRQSTDKASSKRPTASGDSASKKKSKLANVDRTGMKSLTSFFTKK